MVQLSVIIIAFNEEKNIGRCLDSVRGVADDIVVVDSFSTDSTEKICLEKGARFVTHVFEGHIEQKNWAITQAKFPIILSLDADEALSEKLIQSILSIKNKWTHDGYYMNRLTNYCGQWIRHCGWYPDRKLRLWDSRKGKWKGTNPHDKYQMDKGDDSTGFINGDILHYSYYTLHEHTLQVEYFSSVAATAMHKAGKRANTYNMLFNPVLKFARNYFVKLGFLDGPAGFRVCRMSAVETYLKYKKLLSLQKNSPS